MSWPVELTDECTAWWEALDDEGAESIGAVIDMLESEGPTLPFPHSSGIATSKHPRMRELRIHAPGRPAL